MNFSSGSVVKDLPATDRGDLGSIPLGKIAWRRKWQPAPVFLPGESHDREAWWATVHGVA